MHYSTNINRPPDEADNILLQVTTGCTHNNCSFCRIYHDEKFRLSPLEHIEEDLREQNWTNPHKDRVWLLNGDPFTLSYRRLVKIAELIHQYLPNVKTIGMYASIRNIRNKTLEKLKHLRSLGMTGFHIGVETGDEEALKIANTGYTRDEIRDQLIKLEEAGMEYEIGLIAGLGGSRSAGRVGRNTAELLSSLNPVRIFMNTLFLLPGSALSIAIERDEFIPASEKEMLEEHYDFIQHYKGNSQLNLMPTADPRKMFIIKNNSERQEYIKVLEQTIKEFSIITDKNLSATRSAFKEYLFRY